MKNNFNMKNINNQTAFFFFKKSANVTHFSRSNVVIASLFKLFYI